MGFARSWCLGLAAAWLILGWWELRARRWRDRAWSALGKSGRPRGGGLGWWLALGLLIVALAGPRWGRLPGSELPAGHDVVLAVDVSRSMAAEDAVPNRLGLAVEAAEQLVAAVGREPGGRVGVVAFAGRGVLRCPLTDNLGAAVAVLRRLVPGDVRPGGTDLGAALRMAVAAFGPEPDQGRAVVVLSDGEDHVGSWRDALRELREAGVAVHAVAVGDDQRGHPIPLVDVQGRRSELSYQGMPVRTRREDAALAEIARTTGGALVRLGLARPSGLAAIYQEKIQPAAVRQRRTERAPERAEQYAWFALAALVVGLAGSWPGGGPRTLAVLLAVGLIGGAIRGPVGESAATATERGRVAFARGDPAAALAAFEQAIRLDPGAAVPRFDAGAALFALGRYDEARTRYLEARARAQLSLRLKIDFALGNTAFALGDTDAALRHYDDCLSARVVGPGLDAVRRDAALNRRFVERYRRAAAEGAGGADHDENPAPQPAPGPGEHQDEQPGRARGQPTPADTPLDDPQQRLEDALRQARAARRHRLPEPPPPVVVQRDLRDW